MVYSLRIEDVYSASPGELGERLSKEVGMTWLVNVFWQPKASGFFAKLIGKKANQVIDFHC